MIKEIKTDKFEGLAVLVPEGYAGSIANMGYLVVMINNPATLIHEKHFNSPYAIQKQLDRVNKLHEYIAGPAIKLPDGDFKILGKSTELTEEQCAEIVKDFGGFLFDHDLTRYYCYDDYMTIKHPFDSRTFDNAKKSFASLMYLSQCYSVNPYVHPCNLKCIDDDKYDELFFQWQEAQANTGNWLILKKL